KYGICIYPTDTVYGMGACATNPKAVDKIGKIINKDKKRRFSFICSDFSQISQYVKMSNQNFKLMKHYLPGPYTFILPATNYVPKKVCPKRKTVGIRMPNCKTCVELVKLLGKPLANTSLTIPREYHGNPSYFDHTISNEVDALLDIGVLEDPTGSTIIDLTGDYPEVMRLGKGEWHG
ncbi:MAG: threonylcarbamoyl-AMP synthase, partial [archaeon]|nr:threonylcarbamoyl-AMP synthase [archaeon]